MAFSLREDEQFVIEALCALYNGTWKIGEDPPDAYMILKGNKVAVEISILTQHVVGKSGELVSRLSQDTGVLRLCDEIDKALKMIIPPGIYILLTLLAPLKKIRKTKDDLINEIKSLVQKNTPIEQFTEINKNKIKIHFISGNSTSGKKVIGIVANQNSSSDVLANVQSILKERIVNKVKKCSKVEHQPLWLALFNDYWLAEPDIYELAMNNLTIKHQFEKICLVLKNKEVHKTGDGSSFYSLLLVR